MTTVYYHKGKLLGLAAMAGGFSYLCYRIYPEHHGFRAMVLWLAVPASFVLMVGALRKALGDRVALRYDSHSLYIETMWRRRSLLWSQVKSVGIERFTLRQLYGLIKIGTYHYLRVDHSAGLTGGKLRVSTKLLDIDEAALVRMVANLEALHRGVAPMHDVPSNGIRRSDPLEGARESDGFDADAVMARYMAGRTVPAPQPVARKEFGRRIV